MKLALTFSQRLLQLLSLFVIGMALTLGVSHMLNSLTTNHLAAMRITVVTQELLAFILPAIITALTLTRLPADFLRLRPMPSGRKLLLCLGATLVLQPIVEGINRLCQLLPWPQTILDFESQAQDHVMALVGTPSPLNIVITILIVAVLTGLAEELFFRGALQNILHSRPMSPHAAIWIAAAVFALMHGQFVGFIPRTLLGAFFGYSMRWTGSVWTPIACHALNNSLALLLLSLS